MYKNSGSSVEGDGVEYRYYPTEIYQKPGLIFHSLVWWSGPPSGSAWAAATRASATQTSPWPWTLPCRKVGKMGRGPWISFLAEGRWMKKGPWVP